MVEYYRHYDSFSAKRDTMIVLANNYMHTVVIWCCPDQHKASVT